MVVGAGKGEIACEDLVAPTSTLSALFLWSLWSHPSLLPVCMGWDALLLYTDTPHRSGFRRMLTRGVPVAKRRCVCTEQVEERTCEAPSPFLV